MNRPHPRLVVESPATALPADGIDLGVTAKGDPFGIRLSALVEGRLLIQGISGAGKSWLLRRLFERSSGQIQHVIIDPEGEFRSLAESADYPLIDAARLDGHGFAELGLRVRAKRLSIVLDVSQMERESQMIAVAGLLRAMIDCPREDWHPVLVGIDEAHLFAPFGGQGVETSVTRRVVTSTLVDLMSRGRKRGIATVLATQRLARLAKSVASEATNIMVGHNTLDLDIKRAAELLGWDGRRAMNALPQLRQGQFVAGGPAFNVSGVPVTIGAVRSRHIGSTPAISAPPLPSAEEAAELLGIDDLNDEAEARPVALPPGFRAVRDFMADRRAPLAVRLVHEIAPLYPNGALLVDLEEHLGCTGPELRMAVTLLSGWNAVSVESGAIRLERSLAGRFKC